MFFITALPPQPKPIAIIRNLEPRSNKVEELKEEIEKVEEDKRYYAAWYLGNIFKPNPLMVWERRFKKSKRK